MYTSIQKFVLLLLWKPAMFLKVSNGQQGSNHLIKKKKKL